MPYPEIEPGSVTIKLAEPAFRDVQEQALVDMIADAVYQVSFDRRDGWMVFAVLPLVDYSLVLADRGDVAILGA